MEHENNYGSRGMTGTALGLAIGALGVEALRGGFGNILGGGGNKCDAAYTRYDAEKDATISRLESQIQLRDSNTYVDQKMLEMYRYVDGKFGVVEAQISGQSVINAQTAANLSCMQANIATLMGLTKTVIPVDSICPPVAVATTT